MKQLKQEFSDLLHRSTDSHLRIAVTGLSRAGKTAFITSLVNQLLHSSTCKNLPLLQAEREGRFIGAKRIAQNNLMVPRFSYDSAIKSLHETPPSWPKPTRDVSEIRLALKYRSEQITKKLFGHSNTLYLDIVDYPGEWLLDLPLLEMSFAQWSESQFNALTEKRYHLAHEWLQSLEQFEPSQEPNEQQLADIAHQYTQYLLACKSEGLHWVQPGRFVLPGELSGAPVLQFFPYLLKDDIKNNDKAQTQYAMLEARFEEYKKKVVNVFYKEHFATFDRQIVLVDCLQPLNKGHDVFHDMRDALEQLLKSFRYGRNGVLQRLFSPKIDKVLFAATKADHITPEQHPNLVSLLQQMVSPAWQQAAFENITMECMSIASIQATKSGFISQGQKGNQPALQGVSESGESLTLFPGEVPNKLPPKEYWQENGFKFQSFRPLETSDDQACQHLRVDKALQYLIGDKLR